ncbi:MAG: acyl-CoA dehydrogenase family protein [Myxococcota bacterium]
MSEAMQTRHASEDEARQLTEDSRESWAGRSFLRELFLGTLRLDWIDPYPETPESEDFRRFYGELEHFLVHEVDSVEIDRTGEIPDAVLSRLKTMGAFGMKIDKKYGGLGLNQAEYCKVCELLGAHDGNLTALLSAHQSIGVPQPLKLFGTEEQKQRFLPRIAEGAVTAFALTEPDVGSDPARLATEARRTPEGDWILDGEKLWITNGTIADMLVVMARDPETDKISAFVVDTESEGFSVVERCRFMGLRALQNGLLRFDKVRVPAENLIGEEGQGLKIALVTLNTGRLSLPSGAIGAARNAVTWSREWSARRVQWGAPVGKHEAISHKLAEMASQTFAMESWTRLAAELSMRDGYDIRLEAAAAKEWGESGCQWAGRAS